MELKFILEALLFNAQKPLNPAEMREVLVAAAKGEQTGEAAPLAFKKVTVEEITATLQLLEQEHAVVPRSFRLVCVAGSWQFASQAEYAPWLRVLLGLKTRPPRLSQAGLETLAIIAYRQPLTRAEIEQIRGVSVDGVMQTLVERGLVMAVGRAEVVGRPVTYGTTTAFLEYFGLGGLDDLPAADDLRRIEIKKPEALMTVDANLATAPPEQLALAPAADGAPADETLREMPASPDSASEAIAASEPAAGESPPAPVETEPAGGQPA